MSWRQENHMSSYYSHYYQLGGTGITVYCVRGDHSFVTTIARTTKYRTLKATVLQDALMEAIQVNEELELEELDTVMINLKKLREAKKELIQEAKEG